MGHTEHHVVNIRIARVRVELVVDLPLFGFPVVERLDRSVRSERHLHRLGFGSDAHDVIHLNTPRRRGRSAEMFMTNQVGLAVLSHEHRDVLLDDVADEVAQHAPVHHIFSRQLHFDPMGTETLIVLVKTKVGIFPVSIAELVPRSLVLVPRHHRVAVHPGRFHPAQCSPSPGRSGR